MITVGAMILFQATEPELSANVFFPVKETH